MDLPSIVRVLLIEDACDDAELVKQALRKTHISEFQVEHERSVSEALATLERACFDVIVSDLDLPDCNGLVGLEAVVAAADCTPVLVLSGNLDERLALKAASVGVQDYLQKSELKGQSLPRSIFYAIERRTAQEALKRSEALLSEAQSIAHIGSFEWDVISNRVTWSAELYRIHGLDQKTFTASYDGYLSTIFREDRARIDAAVRLALQTGAPFSFEYRMVCPDGRMRVLHGQGRVQADRAGRPTRLVGTCQDITERKLLEDKLAALSLTDELTGLNNRRGLMLLGEQCLNLSERNGSSVTLIYADLDRLKVINDEFGHEQGDQAIQDMASILQKTFRKADVLARIGGDEFVVVAQTDSSHIDALVTRLHANVSMHNAHAGRAFRLSVSVGFAVHDRKAPRTLTDLLAAADSAMYGEKKATRTSRLEEQRASVSDGPQS
jgi:diguanylate cyclase (GGDEF)-like protein/PAS domain S-box-containing protein